MSDLSKQLYQFFTELEIKDKLPNKIEILNPYTNQKVLDINKEFYNQYYSDSEPRILLLGINPGRFGAGITGIAFTDPVNLEEDLSMQNSFKKKSELSATFIHKAIVKYGGHKNFFDKFLLSAISPLGFIKDGININYYDEKALLKATLPFIKSTLKRQYEICGGIKICGCIGQGANLKFLKELNSGLKLFKQIVPLPHPRWIMQYRRKEIDKQLVNYSKKFNEILKDSKKL